MFTIKKSTLIMFTVYNSDHNRATKKKRVRNIWHYNNGYPGNVYSDWGSCFHTTDYGTRGKDRYSRWSISRSREPASECKIKTIVCRMDSKANFPKLKF